MQIQKVTITEGQQLLLSNFTGEQCPDEIDFNYLMAVVRKIVEICNNEKGAYDSSQYILILKIIPYAKIEDSCEVVFDFINWHNQH
jgi:hypothetical protein